MSLGFTLVFAQQQYMRVVLLGNKILHKCGVISIFFISCLGSDYIIDLRCKMTAMQSTISHATCLSSHEIYFNFN